ncbi:hypothetical protein RZN05_03830 [Sphingomonas sp. HF-S4]|uniref:Uncharacterized protein n=1 Tax=Sphingomonas agrestis TaxID=3080540 RepID=A0ABU3Y3X0_9SPHN|nr:hypothetical protein [Sphingomonas sp. HF-S4]MDV3456100.1 hypothetical protein [Sphingomonas sp. HF-S4]
MTRSHSEPRHAIKAQTDTEDQLLGMVTALAAQLAVTRERLDTVERLAQAAGLFGPDEVDTYQPSADAAQARDTIRKTLVARIFRPVRDAAARTAQAIQGDQA